MIILQSAMVVRIGVVGAGIVGLSTAVRTQQELPHAQVTIIADKFGPETTSWGAGGLFRPTTKYTQSAQPRFIRQWMADSAKQYMKIAGSVDAGRYGVFPMSGCHFTNVKEDPEYREFVYSVREMTREELKKTGTQYPYGYAVTTLIIEPSLYLPQLMKQFKANGGRLEKCSLQSLEELVGRFDVVVNCSGLASRWLVNDPLMVPIRGQIMKINAPWVKMFYFDDNDAYVIPRSQDVVIGGVRQKDDDSTEIRDTDRRHILDKVTAVVPSIQGAPIIMEWAGLRPHRSPVRLETERMTFKSGTLPVVHNYGHGPNGIALSWGTAVHATELVKECVQNIKPHSRL